MKPATPKAVRLLLEGSKTLSRMEHNGMRVDVGYLDQAIIDLTRKAADAEKGLKSDKVYREWRRLFGQKANLGSRQQLADVIYKALKYPCTTLTATGKPSTRDEALEGVDLPFVKDYFKWQRMLKGKGTYLDGIKREVCGNYVHPNAKLNTVETMRSSYTEPNIQNVINRDPEMMRIVRRCYIPRKGRVLAEIDYGAAEWKGAACFWKDTEMIRYASDPTKDVHGDLAQELFFLTKEQVDRKTVRDWSKNRFVFPVLYGSYYAKCAPHIWEAAHDPKYKLKGTDIPIVEHLKKNGIKSLGACNSSAKPRPGTYEAHVKTVEDKFFAQFPTFAEKKEIWWKQYLRRGWFRLLTGFIIKGVYTRNFLLNCPIQGPMFHCLLWSIIEIQKELDKRKMKSLLLAEIHDCHLADVPKNEVQDFLTLSKEIMTKRLREAWEWVCVPMEVEVDIAEESWAEKKPWIEDKGIWKPKS